MAALAWVFESHYLKSILAVLKSMSRLNLCRDATRVLLETQPASSYASKCGHLQPSQRYRRRDRDREGKPSLASLASLWTSMKQFTGEKNAQSRGGLTVGEQMRSSTVIEITSR